MVAGNLLAAPAFARGPSSPLTPPNAREQSSSPTSPSTTSAPSVVTPVRLRHRPPRALQPHGSRHPQSRTRSHAVGPERARRLRAKVRNTVRNTAKAITSTACSKMSRWHFATSPSTTAARASAGRVGTAMGSLPPSSRSSTPAPAASGPGSRPPRTSRGAAGAGEHVPAVWSEAPP